MTLKFNNAYIKDAYTLLGKNEFIKDLKVDKKIDDYYDGEKSVELGEVNYQIKSIKGLLKKSKLEEKDISFMIGGDLQNQLLASNFSARKFDIPFLGVYSACSTFTEELLLAASLIEKSEIKDIIITTSAHNLASEKQFRYPIEYGAPRKKVNTFTGTGSVSTLITKTPSKIKIESATIGKVVDLGYKDVNNMGACMAPSAAKSIYEHLTETKRNIDYYDLVLTGDLGVYGIKILEEYLNTEYKINGGNIKDAGVMLFENEAGNTIAGGSGPVCMPLTLFSKVLKENYKKILLVATGSLHSKTSSNLNESVPSVAHVISLEVIK